MTNSTILRRLSGAESDRNGAATLLMSDRIAVGALLTQHQPRLDAAAPIIPVPLSNLERK